MSRTAVCPGSEVFLEDYSMCSLRKTHEQQEKQLDINSSREVACCISRSTEERN